MILDDRTVSPSEPRTAATGFLRPRALSGRLSPGVAIVAVLLAGLNVTALWQQTFAGRFYTLGFLLVVPGAVLLSLTPIRPREAAVRITWALGVSMLLLMLLGLGFSLVLPHLGIARPLRPVPLLVGTDVCVVVSLFACGPERDPLAFLFADASPGVRDVAVAALAALLPIAAAAGAERLNNGDGGTLSIAVLAGAGALLVLLFVLDERLRPSTVGLVLYGTTAAALLLTSMRTTHPFGYDIQTEFQVFTSTLHRGAWQVPPHGNAYAAMLSITVLPSVLSTISGVSPIYLFKFLYPLVFSLFPVLVYLTARRLFPRRAALVGAVVVITQGLFAADITGLARQEIGLLYFGLFVVTTFDTALPRRWRQIGAAVGIGGMAISHYSTAYFATIVVAGGYLVHTAIRLLSKRNRDRGVVTLPLVAFDLGVVTLWNVVITRSAANIGNVVSSLVAHGLALLPGASGASFIQRFLNADVSPTVGASHLATIATQYYRASAPYLHPYPPSLTSRYPVIAATVPGAGVSSPLRTAVDNAATICSELVLLAAVVGVVAFLWRSVRTAQHTEVATFALACIILLGLLRLSGTLSTLYNASRGLVQGAPLFSLGIALTCSYLFSRRGLRGTSMLSGTVVGLVLLLVTNSSLSVIAAGGATDMFANGGETYQRFDFTDADIFSADWLVHHRSSSQVVYADIYAGLQIYEIAHIPALVTTVIPQVLEPGAYVYASSTNTLAGTARSLVAGNYAVYRFPSRFLHRVKDVVFTTGTTEVYR